MPHDYVESFARILLSVRRETGKLLKTLPLEGEQMRLQVGGRELEVYLHRSAEKNAPVLFEMHGGGFAVGDAAVDDSLRQTLCRELGVNVVGVNYRKTPEHPYPAALDDVCDAVRYFAGRGDAFSMDPSRLAVMGFSAGANLATAAAIRLGREGGPRLCCQVLHYPYLDAKTPAEDKPHFDADMPIELMYTFTELYTGPELYGDPLVSPVWAGEEDLAGLPPALVMPAKEDSLAEEGLRYGDRLARAGVPVTIHQLPDTHHGYVEDHYNRPVYEGQEPEKLALHHPEFGVRAETAMAETMGFLHLHFDMR